MGEKQEEFLYTRIADRFESMILNGVLKTGDKLPSVRILSEEQGISISTAYMAYSSLESKGLIEARPKSGYYVRYADRSVALPPRNPAPAAPSSDMSVDEMIATVYENLTETSVVQMSLAAPSVDLLPSAKINKCLLEALRRSPTSCLHYEQIQGNEQLRQQLARLAFNWGGKCTADDVIVTQGCMEALAFCLQAVTQPGDVVAIERPTYFGIFNLLKNLGLRALEIPTDPDTGPDLDFLRAAISKDQVNAVLFVPSFNNPLGSLMPDGQKKALVEMLAEKQIPLVEDDIYGEMYFGKTRPRTCKSYDTEGLVLYCSSVSKSLAPGYRIGWCIPGRYKKQVLHNKLTHCISSATPTQAAIALFCENGRFDLHLRHLRKALHTQCLRYWQAVKDFFPAETRVSQPQGGYVLWLELPEQVDAFQLFHRAKQHQILIAPGQIFSVAGCYSHHIRLGFGAPYSEEIEKSLNTLGSIIQDMANKPVRDVPRRRLPVVSG
ncbi:MAG: PLP-dependent aminotransferase family protein [Lewinellaceae bacterium]|nr:PLP-dependent aminotransferase family protein [Lewinellaceae bacterium]